MCAISHISHFKIRRVSQPCAHITVDALCTILLAQANINFRCRLWMCELLRDNGIFILPAGFLFEQFLVLDPVDLAILTWGRLLISSHFITWPVWQALKGKRERGGFGGGGMGWRAPDFPSSPFPLSTPATQADWSQRSSCLCCHAMWWGADVKNTDTATQETTLSATAQFWVSSRNASSSKEGGELCDNVKNGRTIEETFTYRCYFSGMTVKCMNNRKNTGRFQCLQNKHQINGKKLATDISGWRSLR